METRPVLLALTLPFIAVAAYHRIRSQRTGESLDRTQEGWPILILLRLTGLATWGAFFAGLWNPELLAWAAVPWPEWARWLGVAGYALSIAWLAWMFHSLGPNLTDTVVTRRAAEFVEAGPYRWVRNPMYTGLLTTTFSLGFAQANWFVPAAGLIVFLILAARTSREEAFLLARFGATYRDYMSRVGRFWPRPEARA